MATTPPTSSPARRSHSPSSSDAPPGSFTEELRARGYSPRKIRENIEAELLGTCLVDALAVQDPERICEIDTTGITPEETVELIIAALDGETECRHGVVDWMNHPEVETLLREP